ncbi:retrovirus-related pol polyprotein from transposon TNT 1-94 [Tanacetum coccineum]
MWKPSRLPQASEEDSDPEQAQRDKDMQKNLALIAKYFKKIYKPTNNNLRTSSNTRNKNVDTTPRYNTYLHNVFADDMTTFEQSDDQNDVECDDERAALANLIANLKLDVIVQLILFIVDSGCTKHMTGNLSLLCNFVEKYLGTVRFGNDQFCSNSFVMRRRKELEQSPRTPEQNGVVERRNRTLVEAARMMLSASKLPLFFWAEAIATACYTQNRSIIIPTHEKMAYHIINDRKPSIKHLHIFGCTCYLTRDGENLDKMKEKGDPCILVGYSTQSKGYRVYNKRTRLIVESIHLRFDEIKEMSETSVANDTSGLELDILFGPLYDEFFNDGTSRVNKSSSPTDNSIKKDTLPSTHIQPTSEPTTPTNVHAEENNDNQVEFTNPLCTPLQENAESSSRNIVRGNPSKPVQTRQQLATDPEMCMFALTVSMVEPKNIKDVMADSAWIEAIQEELHQFDRLQEEGIDFEESFAPVARLEAVKSTKIMLHTSHFQFNPWTKDYRLKESSIWIEASSKSLTRHSASYLLSCTDIKQDGLNICKGAFLDVRSFPVSFDTRKSTSGGIQFLGDKLVSWMSKKQDCTAMSSAEAEYVALSASYAQVMWMRTQLQDYGFNYNKIPLFQYLVRRIGMRCLTPAELEVLTNESA